MHLTFDEDIAVKRFSARSVSEKPRFDWSTVLPQEVNYAAIRIDCNGTEKAMDVGQIADTIGSALTDLLLARNESDIFTAHNQAFVANVAHTVAEELSKRLAAKQSLTEQDLYTLIEQTLLRHQAHDVAKSVWLHRQHTHQATLNSTIRLVRRNQQVVPWDTRKVETAIRKAFLSLELDSSPASEVAKEVTNRVHALGLPVVDIEQTQDMVQEELMRMGYFKVAESYILYRAHRATLRGAASEADSAARQESMILIQNDNGETYLWDGLELRKRIEYAMQGLDLILSQEDIETELRRSLYAEMRASDLKKTIILNAKTLIEKDADFSKFAARILLSYMYEETLGWSIVNDGVAKLKEFHARYFRSYLEHAVRIERIHPNLLEYDLEALAQHLDPAADLGFDYLGIQTLYDRYLIIDKTTKPHRRIETPQIFWMRVAMGLFTHETTDKEGWVLRLYTLYKSRLFCSSTPTLFNAGTVHSQLSSCYLYKVDDSIDSIMYRGISENAFLAKWAGGLGGSWTAVRGTGSYIKGTNGESQGVIPFLKIFNDTLVAVNQGGKRLGVGVAYLETWHNDIVDFLELRKNTGDERRRTHEMNTANWIPDLFMKRMEAREDWTLFHSNQVPDLHSLYGKRFEARYAEYEKMAEEGLIFGQKIPANELWKKMLSMIFETGHPWITFKDPCNIRSPQDHAGVIHSSNLCTEITLNTGADETAVCNLGSIILHNHLKADGSIDHAKLQATIQVAVRALDNIIDLNFYPTEAARTSNMRHRPVGLGLMGLQNALYIRGEAFDSDAAVEFNDECMEAIAYYAYEASSELALERGTYSSYKGSKWDRGLLPLDTIDLLEAERGLTIDVPRTSKMNWEPLRAKIRKQGMRNSNVLSIAPTATISNIMNTVPCIEPTYKNLFVKNNLSGDFVILNEYLIRDLKKLNLWNQEMLDQLKYFDGELTHIETIPSHLKATYKTAFDIPYTYIIQAASRRQKWIDQSQSVNLFMGQPDLKALSHMYRFAFHAGLKTTYYLRTLGASNIEKATVSVKKATRGVMGQDKPTAEQIQACSLEAMLNGGTCEACQ